MTLSKSCVIASNFTFWYSIIENAFDRCNVPGSCGDNRKRNPPERKPFDCVEALAQIRDIPGMPCDRWPARSPSTVTLVIICMKTTRRKPFTRQDFAYTHPLDRSWHTFILLMLNLFHSLQSPARPGYHSLLATRVPTLLSPSQLLPTPNGHLIPSNSKLQ